MTCALHDGTPLVLTPEEQRDLIRKVNALEVCLVNLFDGRDDGGPAMVDAVALLYHLHDDEPEYDPQEAHE